MRPGPDERGAQQEEGDGGLAKIGEIRAPHAHSVAVDPATHRVYLPLASIAGRPVMRVFEAGPREARPRGDRHGSQAANPANGR